MVAFGISLTTKVSVSSFGRHNHITIKNFTDEHFPLVSYYTHRGKCLTSPDPAIRKKSENYMVFLNPGLYSISGSSGIVQWQLPGKQCDEKKYLIVSWNAPFNFYLGNNFIAMWIYDTAKKYQGSDDINVKDPKIGLRVFKEMHQRRKMKKCLLNNLHGLPKKSEAGSSYHLVCSGPGKYNANANWGYREPCYVKNEKYEVKATMGDRHAAKTSITIDYVE